MLTIDKIVSAFRKYTPDNNGDNITRAYEFAESSHLEQKRKSGEPYIQHPLEAAKLLTKIRVDETTIIACLLHDVPEDTDSTLAQVEQHFGEEIAQLVNGVTKVSKVQYRNNMEEHQIESLRKMFLVMARDLRVVLIKLSDRLHNMETLDAVRPDKQKRIARETLEIYAPLADRLGIFQYKWRLEDLCFKHLHEKEYNFLKQQLAETREEREDHIKNVIKTLNEEFEKNRIVAKENGRTKHMYSIYQKMVKKNRSLDEIYDLFAVRVIVHDVRDCYSVLGVVHDLWRPKPGRFKDYIAIPKANGYQSLHTTVFCRNGKLTEFQIRTERMHEEAEYGAPAHWFYSKMRNKQKNVSLSAPSDQLDWVNQLSLLNENLLDNKEFIEGLKIDLFKDRIFVFTPGGDVIDLPRDSTPIDFAYTIHTDLGHGCIGAKIDGKIVPLDVELKTGNVVEILSTKIPTGPKRDWLSFVKTNTARSKIRAWLKDENREQNLMQGLSMLEKELSRLVGKTKLTSVASQNISKAIDNLPYNNLDSILVAVGEGTLTPVSVIKKMYSSHELFPGLPLKKSIKKTKKDKLPHIIVEGHQNVQVNIAKCCNCDASDKIVGYTTVEKGISIHKHDCHNIIKADPSKLIDTRWSTDREGTRDELFEVEIRVIGHDRVGLLRDMLTILSKLNINVTSMQARNLVGSDGIDDLIRIQVHSLSDLSKVFEKLQKVEGIDKVIRI